MLYMPGTRKLIESWSRHNDAIPIIALSDQEEALDSTFLQTHATERILIAPNQYADIAPYKKRHSQRHARTFYKFEAFADFGYDQNIFLDSDILCLAPCPLLLKPNTNTLLKAAKDTGFRPRRGYKGSPNEINSGVLVIDRALQGRNTIQTLHQIAIESPGHGGYNSGDQGIINKWIRKESIPIEILPQNYNLIKKDYSDCSQIEDCCLLHFTDRKPWFPQPEREEETQALTSIWRDA
tara:strand:+ start:1344 stop:2057 length:714 start_codon:yes stop_codon:yes gene_type:complete